MPGFGGGSGMSSVPDDDDDEGGGGGDDDDDMPPLEGVEAEAATVGGSKADAAADIQEID